MHILHVACFLRHRLRSSSCLWNVYVYRKTKNKVRNFATLKFNDPTNQPKTTATNYKNTMKKTLTCLSDGKLNLKMRKTYISLMKKTQWFCWDISQHREREIRLNSVKLVEYRNIFSLNHQYAYGLSHGKINKKCPENEKCVEILFYKSVCLWKRDRSYRVISHCEYEQRKTSKTYCKWITSAHERSMVSAHYTKYESTGETLFVSDVWH